MLEQFSEQKYINLETYKRDNTPIKTPVWFVIDNGLVYIITRESTGKVKRLKNNQNVRIVPCSFKGEIKSLGAWGGDFILASGINSPSYFESKGYKTIIKFDDMMEFFQNIQQGITRSQNYQYDETNNKSTQLPDVDLEKEIPNLDEKLTEQELSEEGITITDDGKILIEVN